MRLGVITSSYPLAGAALAAPFVGEHVRWLEAQGHEVDVVAPAPRALGWPDAWELAAGWRARVRWLGAAGATQAALVEAAYQRARARRWDAVCAHWLAPSGIAAMIAVRRELPLLAIAHGGDVALLRRARLIAPVMAALVARGAKLAWVSASLRDQALAACPTRVAAAALARSICTPMGIDEARFAAVAARRAAAAADPSGAWLDAKGHAHGAPLRVLAIARLVPVKGVAELIAALAQVERPCHLVIAGDGPDRAALACQAQAVCAQAPRHRVRFAGQLGPAQIDDELACADLVVVPSRREGSGDGPGVDRGEGMPVVALEAVAAGVPLIHTGSGGLLQWERVMSETRDIKSATGAAQAAWMPRGQSSIGPQLDQGVPVATALARAINAHAHAHAPQPPAWQEHAHAARAHLGWAAVGPALWSHWL